MEKTFALRSSGFANNGELAVYQTVDKEVVYLVILNPQFSWPRRESEECFRCSKCNQFIYPGQPFDVSGGKVTHRGVCK